MTKKGGKIDKALSQSGGGTLRYSGRWYSLGSHDLMKLASSNFMVIDFSSYWLICKLSRRIKTAGVLPQSTSVTKDGKKEMITYM